MDPQQIALEEAIAQQQGEAPVNPTGETAAPDAGVPGDETDPAAGQIIAMLIAAYCAEKVSEYQYEVAINIGLGKARNYFLSECTEHRQEEHDHADMLAARIDELGGTIPFTLSQVSAQNPAGDPEEVEGNRDTSILTQQIIEAEQFAVELYSEIEKATRDVDPITNDMIIDILATEQKHVVDMSKIMITIES